MSLQTKDLRLNNLLEVDGEIIQVGKIEEKHITWNLSKNDNLRVWNPFLPINDERIKPINLTEEWLFIFGFKKIDHHRFKIQPSQYDWFYTYSIHDNAFRFYVEDIIVCLNTIFYVHQLQNLYFALIGTDLVVYDAVS